jgi:holin-like protein
VKILKQLSIILGIWFVGEMISKLSGIPIPGNVIGMIILLLLLVFKVIKVDTIKETSEFMLKNMGIFFIPPGVGILVSAKLLKGSGVEFVLLVLISTFFVMGITGVIVQFLEKGEKK